MYNDSYRYVDTDPGKEEEELSLLSGSSWQRFILLSFIFVQPVPAHSFRSPFWNDSDPFRTNRPLAVRDKQMTLLMPTTIIEN